MPIWVILSSGEEKHNNTWKALKDMGCLNYREEEERRETLVDRREKEATSRGYYETACIPEEEAWYCVIVDIIVRFGVSRATASSGGKGQLG